VQLDAQKFDERRDEWQTELAARFSKEAAAEEARVEAAVRAARKAHEEILAKKEEELKMEMGAATRIQAAHRGCPLLTASTHRAALARRATADDRSRGRVAWCADGSCARARRTQVRG
jgi:hypothetical protein